MICNKKFANKYALRQHKNIHDKVHQCETCLKCFISKNKLDEHIRTHTGEKPYECSICGKRFTRKENLNNHVAIHSDVRKFKCNICPDGRSFKTKNELSIHMKFHYEPKYLCNICQKKFHTSSNLNCHMKCHYEPKHSCPKCGKKFHTSSNMKQYLTRNMC